MNEEIKIEKPINQLKQIKRDENGLVIGLEYKYTDEGLIDWRSMVPIKYLYVNSDMKNRVKIEKKYGKNYSEIDIINDKVDDQDLIISLAGLKYIGRIRGILEVNEQIKESNIEYASVTSHILYAPNFESENKPIRFSASASATSINTVSFYQKYLIEAASNRAFARNIRNFLGINVVSRDEILGGSENEYVSIPNNDKVDANADIQTAKLLSVLNKKKLSFELLKDKLIKEKFCEGIENINSIDDIPKGKIFELIERLKKFKPEK